MPQQLQIQQQPQPQTQPLGQIVDVLASLGQQMASLRLQNDQTQMAMRQFQQQQQQQQQPAASKCPCGFSQKPASPCQPDTCADGSTCPPDCNLAYGRK